MTNKSETKTELATRHAKSAALTFAAVLVVEVSSHLNGVSSWEDVSWSTLFSAATFTATRSALKFLGRL